MTILILTIYNHLLKLLDESSKQIESFMGVFDSFFMTMTSGVQKVPVQSNNS